MIHGILNVRKEKGYTSHDVVAKLRGIVGQRKIGHTGTLDPDAEGVLPICLGRATKLCDMLTDKDKKAIILRAKELFANVGISEETQNKFPAQISGGEAQRAGMVRALINSPEILFADEPTGALNSKTGLDVLDTLTRFNEEGQSIVMVTHDMRSARRGSRILYLKDGVIMGECDLGKYARQDDAARQEKLASFLAEMGG